MIIFYTKIGHKVRHATWRVCIFWVFPNMGKPCREKAVRGLAWGAMSWLVCHWKGNLDASGPGPQCWTQSDRWCPNTRVLIFLGYKRPKHPRTPTKMEYQKHMNANDINHGFFLVPVGSQTLSTQQQIMISTGGSKAPFWGREHHSLNMKQWLTTTKWYIYIYIEREDILYTEEIKWNKMKYMGSRVLFASETSRDFMMIYANQKEVW